MRARRVAGRRSPSWVDVAMAQAAEVSTDNIRLTWREGGGDVTLDVDPQDPHFTGNAVGLAYVRQNGHLITGARLVFRDLKWVKTNVVIHEVGHFLGFEHSVEGRDIMTGIYVWTGRPFFTDGERWAMNMMLQRSLGNTYPDTAPGPCSNIPASVELGRFPHHSVGGCPLLAGMRGSLASTSGSKEG